MAQQTVVTLIDDLSGGEADETVVFGLDGKTYEIDLNTKNADKLRKFLESYVKAGRKTSARPTVSRGRGPAAKNGGEDTAVIRTWAKEQGYEINDRGRVPATIREAYAKANG